MMTLRDLHYVITIAEMKSISKAAEKVFIAQPSLSHSLHRIEEELGVVLFNRTSAGLKPTIAGEYYINTARDILSAYSRLESRLSHLNDMKAGRLVIGTTNFLGSVILPQILYVFQNLYPNIEVSIVEGVSQEIEGKLLGGDVDVGVIHYPFSNACIKCTKLVKEPFFLAVPPGDPLNSKSYVRQDGQRCIDLRLTDKMDYILTRPEQRTCQRCLSIISKAGITPKIKYTTSSIQTAARMSGVGLGLTLVPQLYSILFNQNTLPNFYRIEDEFDPYWELAVCYANDQFLSKAAQKMIDICEEIMPNLYTAMNRHPQNHIQQCRQRMAVSN